MSRRTSILILLIAATIGALSAWTLYRYDTALTAMTGLVVPVKQIAPYTVITPDMVEVRAFPEAVAQADVYRSVDEVIGKLATTALVPGQLIYVHELTAPQSFRYTENAQLEVVSFPVKPEHAVGAQLRIGQRINVYRPDKQTNPIAEGLLIADVQGAAERDLIVTVAAPSDVVEQIMQSSVSARDSLWVTLAPIPSTAQVNP